MKLISEDVLEPDTTQGRHSLSMEVSGLSACAARAGRGVRQQEAWGWKRRVMRFAAPPTMVNPQHQRSAPDCAGDG